MVAVPFEGYRDILIEAGAGEPQCFGVRYAVHPEAVERPVERALAMTGAELQQRRAAARRWYEENDRRFEERLKAALACDLSDGGD